MLSAPDLHFPKTHTCFFSISLPPYSSAAVLKKKLVYAMEVCGTMDADHKLHESEIYNYEADDL